MGAIKSSVERENINDDTVACPAVPENDNSLKSSPVAQSAQYKRCRKEIFLKGKPSSLLHNSLGYCNSENRAANNQKKMGSPLYLRDLKNAASSQNLSEYYAVLGEYYELDCTPEQEAKHYAIAFYIAEHYGCKEIKSHINGVISQLLRNKLKTDLTTLSHMLNYKKEFHKIYPQLIALLQVHINDAVTNLDYKRVSSIYNAEIPLALLKKNYTYLVEMPGRFAKQIFKSFPQRSEAEKMCDLFADLRVRLFI